VFAFFTWLTVNTPMGLFGFLGFILLGVALSLFYPLIALLAVEAPGALVPCNWRAYWRRGQEHRPAVRRYLRRIVYAADRHACCYCRRSAGLQLDHFRPWSLGGRTSFYNSFTLCRDCNIIKSNYWIRRDGRVVYKPFEGKSHMTMAAAILAAERRARRNPARWIRAAVAL
jgi:hypothetical protein